MSEIINYSELLMQRVTSQGNFITKNNTLYKVIDSVVYSMQLQKSKYFENSVFIVFGIFFRELSPNSKIPVGINKCHFEIRYGDLYNRIIKVDTKMNLPLVIDEKNINEIVDNIINKFVPYLVNYFSINSLKNNYPNIELPNVVLAYIDRADFIRYLQNK